MVSSAQGTRVILNADGTVNVVPPGVNYQLPYNAKELKQVSSVQIDFSPGDVVKAEIRAFPTLSFLVETSFVHLTCLDAGGQERRIKQIVFFNGDKITFSD